MSIRSVHLTVTPLLVQLILLIKMRTAYLQRNNQRDLHRESLMSLILQNGAQPRIKEEVMDIVNKSYNTNMPVPKEKRPGTVLRPLAAYDNRTTEGQKTKHKRKGQMCVDIPKPSEKQTIAIFNANARQCEELHCKAPLPKFGSERKRVIKDLMERKIQRPDVTIEMIPSQMGAIDKSASSSLPASSTTQQVCISLELKFTLINHSLFVHFLPF